MCFHFPTLETFATVETIVMFRSVYYVYFTLVKEKKTGFHSIEKRGWWSWLEDFCHIHDNLSFKDFFFLSPLYQGDIWPYGSIPLENGVDSLKPLPHSLQLWCCLTGLNIWFHSLRKWCIFLESFATFMTIIMLLIDNVFSFPHTRNFCHSRDNCYVS